MITKKKYHQIINEKFYKFVEEKLSEYELDFDSEGGSGRVLLYNNKVKNHERGLIEYHLSRHDISTLNWADQEVKDDANVMRKFISEVELETKKLL